MHEPSSTAYATAGDLAIGLVPQQPDPLLRPQFLRHEFFSPRAVSSGNAPGKTAPRAQAYSRASNNLRDHQNADGRFSDFRPNARETRLYGEALTPQRMAVLILNAGRELLPIDATRMSEMEKHETE